MPNQPIAHSPNASPVCARSAFLPGGSFPGLAPFLLASLLLVGGLRSRADALSPEEERASFQFADPAFTAEVVASEPDVLSPVAMTWDSAGRMFVAEMIDYPLGPAGGQVRMLEDRDQDGRYETSTVFADHLSFPNGVLPWNGGLLVTSAPDILFLKDTDGDGKADERRVILTGFAEGNQQLRVNGLMWGLDGWVYGANGRSDGEMHRPGETNSISLRGHDFRFRPETGEFEALAGRSQFGVTRDDWGNRFLSWNTVPIRHEVIPERFLLRNPRISTSEALHDLLPADDTGRVYPLTPAPQTFNNESTSHFNALAGLTIYRGDLLPAQYKGNAFMGETLRNLVHRRVLEANGSTFVAKRVEQEKEFLASTDPWFHPVNFATGPDGALYIADFYRQWVEHPGYVPEKLRGSVEWRTGAEHGRIWRVKPKQSKTPRKLNLDLSTAKPERIVQSLENPNAWWRDTALRVLRERNETNAAPKIERIALHGRLPEARVEALYTLAALKKFDFELFEAAVRDDNAHVREAAIQIGSSRFKGRLDFEKQLAGMARDPDPRVRLQLALNLADANTVLRVKTLTALALRSDLDHITIQAIRASLGNRPWLVLQEVWNAKPAATAAMLEFLRDLAGDVAAGANEHDHKSFINRLTKQHGAFAEDDLALFAGFSSALPPGRTFDRSSEEQDFVAGLATFAAIREVRPATSPLVRDLAATVLARAATDEAASTLFALLLPSAYEEAQVSAVNAIVSSANPALFRGAFADWGQYQISTRKKLLAGSVRTSDTIKALVEALQTGRVAAAELDASVRQTLLQTKDPALRLQVANLLGPELSPDRTTMVNKYLPALKMTGDAKRGAATFAKTCLQCHSVEGQGQHVGPDLSGVASRPREALLLDVLDPSRNVASDYLNYIITTSGGESLSGLIVSENSATITVRRAGVPDETLSRNQVKLIQASGKSLMPDGLETGLAPRDIADLLEFLQHPDAKLLP